MLVSDRVGGRLTGGEAWPTGGGPTGGGLTGREEEKRGRNRRRDPIYGWRGRREFTGGGRQQGRQAARSEEKQWGSQVGGETDDCLGTRATCVGKCPSCLHKLVSIAQIFASLMQNLSDGGSSLLRCSSALQILEAPGGTQQKLSCARPHTPHASCSQPCALKEMAAQGRARVRTL
jgi:hypothetical protein